jgi:hypothetical protein
VYRARPVTRENRKQQPRILDRDHRLVSEGSGRATTSIDDLPLVLSFCGKLVARQFGTFATEPALTGVLPNIRFAPNAHIRSRPLTISSISKLLHCE